MKNSLDKRYSINLEWCGHDTQKFVVRFCGGWVGYGNTEREAKKLIEKYENSRWEDSY